MKAKKIVLTIAGSDPSGGAGIQADLKAFTLLDVHGTTAITSITAQNTQGVKTIYPLPVDLIEKQIDVLYEDLEPSIVKTGMLYNKETITCIAKKIKQYDMKTIVDPVMQATSGDTLSKSNIAEVFKTQLLPRTYMLTPNIEEAQMLTNSKISDLNDVKENCKELATMGPQYVLVKGGHLSTNEAFDVLFDGKEFTIFSLPGIPKKKAHGSGCTLSALITALLADGKTVVNAVGTAKNILWKMIRDGYNPGKGADVLNFTFQVKKDFPPLFATHQQISVWLDLIKSIEVLTKVLPVKYVPEVGINFGYALPNAEGIEDICGIDGRIIKSGGKTVRSGNVWFGGSKHIASIILTAMQFDNDIRSCVNLRFSEETVKKAEKKGLTIGFFDRKEEPDSMFSSMEWGTKNVIEQEGYIPDVIYDRGDVGKEPMIRVLGKNPQDVFIKTKKLIN